MIKFIASYFSHTDGRGSIRGVIQSGKWEEVNMVSSQKGTVRGGHYHKETQELFVILFGKIEVTTQKVEDGQLVGEPAIVITQTDDVFLVEPFVNHTFNCLEDSRWMNLLSKRMDKDQMDFYRAGSIKRIADTC
jgi:dTDP-4-dehydrorhamnose 3,5-epimerase-like enzyme